MIMDKICPKVKKRLPLSSQKTTKTAISGAPVFAKVF
jgi:hypothetical protein